jgi:predicted enzyme related to lactoylglutathione lyase
METHERFLHRFVWHDLMTKDGPRAKDFYSRLLGWQVTDVPMQGFVYRMIHAGPGPIGGIVEEANIPAAHWMPYIAVADVDAATAKAESLGATTCVPPSDIPGTGRFAVLGDPQGGYFSVYRGNPDSQGADPDAPVPGRVCWNELWTKDPAGALAFYGAMFGWTDEPKDLGAMGTYHMQSVGGKEVAGILRSTQPDVPTCWLAYFLVEDLAVATQKIGSLGGTVVMPPTPIPGIGQFSIGVDPTGASFALFSE